MIELTKAKITRSRVCALTLPGDVGTVEEDVKDQEMEVEESKRVVLKESTEIAIILRLRG